MGPGCPLPLPPGGVYQGVTQGVGCSAHTLELSRDPGYNQTCLLASCEDPGPVCAKDKPPHQVNTAGGGLPASHSHESAGKTYP